MKEEKKMSKKQEKQEVKRKSRDKGLPHFNKLNSQF